jgi:hypothetical protein
MSLLPSAKCAPACAKEIHVTLNLTNPVVTGATIRKDSHLLRFLVGVLLSEWTQWWRDRTDARRIREVFLADSEVPSRGRYEIYWTSLANVLANSELLSRLNQLTLSVPQELVSLDIELRVVSDIPKWRVEPTSKVKR